MPRKTWQDVEDGGMTWEEAETTAEDSDV